MGCDDEWSAAMRATDWTKPEFRRGEVDWAGRRLAQLMKPPRWDESDREDWTKSLDIINNWRSAHAYPLNTFQATLRGKTRKVDSNAIVAQRTKRLWSFWNRLVG